MSSPRAYAGAAAANAKQEDERMKYERRERERWEEERAIAAALAAWRTAPSGQFSAAAGGAATGGTGTAAEGIPLTKEFMGFEGAQQTRLIFEVFGNSVKGLTAREIFETSSPTTQCTRVIGEPESCWICGISFAHSATAFLGRPQCEHLLPITQAVMYLGLYSHEEYLLLPPDRKTEYLEYLKLEYRWAHAQCNYLKKSEVYIRYNARMRIYEVADDKIKKLINDVLKIFPFSELKPAMKDSFKKTQLNAITNLIYTPIVNHLNTRWLSETGKGIPAQGLDQLSAIAALITAPKTKVGAAAVATANMGTRTIAPIPLPTTPEGLYDSISRKTTNFRLTDPIKRQLENNLEIQNKILILYRKIPLIATSKDNMNRYITAVDEYAIYLAQNAQQKLSSSGRIILRPVIRTNPDMWLRIRELEAITLPVPTMILNTNSLSTVTEEEEEEEVGGYPVVEYNENGAPVVPPIPGTFVVGLTDELARIKEAREHLEALKKAHQTHFDPYIERIVTSAKRNLQAQTRRQTSGRRYKIGGWRRCRTRKNRRSP